MTELVRTIPSACGRYKVEITRRSENVFQVEALKWTEEWVDGYGKLDEFWERLPGLITFTDSLTNAEALALERLRELQIPVS